MKLKVIRANEMGMCFGVKDALNIAHSLQDPTETAIHGELVHNEEVLKDLSNRGFQMSPESRRTELPESPKMLVTAHGISDKERERLRVAGKDLIDTTCPLVRRVHLAARNLERAVIRAPYSGRLQRIDVQEGERVWKPFSAGE